MEARARFNAGPSTCATIGAAGARLEKVRGGLVCAGARLAES